MGRQLFYMTVKKKKSFNFNTVVVSPTLRVSVLYEQEEWCNSKGEKPSQFMFLVNHPTLFPRAPRRPLRPDRPRMPWDKPNSPISNKIIHSAHLTYNPRTQYEILTAKQSATVCF